MSRAELNWFRLRFPEGLKEDDALAALAVFTGLPAATRLVLDLAGDAQGISHSLGISAPVTEGAAAALRAAIPSLRLMDIQAPPRLRHSVLWQLAPRVAALRTDELPALSAALLSSLFPLAEGEAVRLRWQLSPAIRPALPIDPDHLRDGRTTALRTKLARPGLSAWGQLQITAATAIRRREIWQRLASVLRSLATPHGQVVADPAWYGQLMRLVGRRGRFFSVPELLAVIGWPVDGPDLPGLTLGVSKRLVPDARLSEGGRVLGVSDFPGLARPVALSEGSSTKGLYVLGPTGTGKTSLLKNLIRSDLEQGRGLVAVETNGDLIRELTDLIPPHRIGDVILLDPTDPDYAVGFNPFAGSADPSLVADQLGELFERLWAAFWGPRTAQLTHMGLLTLAQRKGSTLLDLPRLFLDPAFRSQALVGLDDPVGLGPDWRWFAGLSEREQATVIAPLLNKVRAFTARPAIRSIVGQPEPKLTMREVIDGQKVLLTHLPKGLIGAETAQLLGCLVLTATWQALVGRVATASSRRHPFGVYVDEVQDFAAAPIPWDELFAQGRKYGLALTVAHQNLSQLPKDLREVVLANARSKAVFALSAADAKVLEGLFAPALSADDLRALDPYAVAALVALDDGAVARPATLVTPAPPQPLGSAEQVRRSSRARYARQRTEIETALRGRAVGLKPTAPVGRKRRSQP